MNKINDYLISILLSALLVCSCSEFNDVMPDGASAVDLSFTLEIPATTNVNTRAYDDNSVRNLDLLVFDASDKFVERIRVNAVSGTGSTKTFSARLTASATKRTIHIIANARDESNNDMVNFSSIIPGTAMSTAIPGLTSATLTAGQSPKLPVVMWGRVELSSVTSLQVIGTPIPMLRMVASMYMTCDPPTTANGLGLFTLKGFSVVNAYNEGKVAPVAYTSNATTPTTPSLPSSIGFVNYAVNATTWGTMQGNGNTSELYLYENPGSQATDMRIIIHGVWDGVEGYYPVWVSDAAGQYPAIVRNHRYCVTVKGVYGTGYATLTDAMSAMPANKLVLVDVSEMTDIITDGEYLLGVQRNDVVVFGGGLRTITTVKKTDPFHTLDATSADTWLSGITFTAVTGKPDHWALSATFAPYTGVGARATIVTVRVGSLTRTVRVEQVPPQR